MADIKRIKASELTPDLHNANKGTERGQYMLEASLREHGAGRSILIDKNGRVIAGNKTLETAADVGLDDVVVVQTDGTQIVAVQRMDLDLAEDEGARKLAFADNRVGEVSLEWDFEAIQVSIDDGLDLSGMWQDWELEGASDEEWGEAFGGLPDEDRAPFQQMTFTLHDTQAEEIKAALGAAKRLGDGFEGSPNGNSNGNALALICETFITEHGQS